MDDTKEKIYSGILVLHAQKFSMLDHSFNSMADIQSQFIGNALSFPPKLELLI